MKQLDILKTACEHLGLSVDDSKLENIEKYNDLLVEWNKRISLFSKNDKDLLISRHIMESIVPLSILEIPINETVFDIGTGAGFPGIPIKIMRKDLKLLLIESIRKKGLFLNKVITTLNLEDTRVICERAEKLDSRKAGTTNFVFAREVGRIDLLLKLAFPLLNKGGFLITYKSPEEAKLITGDSIKALHASASLYQNTGLPNWKDKTRQTHLVVIQK